MGRPPSALSLSTVVHEDDHGDVREGVLVCAEPLCQREHPIVDGIPIVVADLPSWATHQLDAVLWRQDLSPFTESLLGDAAGPASAFDRERTTLSAYGRVHWGDFDCEEPLPAESSLGALVRTAFEALPGPHSVRGTWVDLGCAVGRATRELALDGSDLAVGVDLSFGMLRVAERARREGLAVYPIRRVGLVFDRREVEIPDMPTQRISFWCADVDNLPFADGGFDGALSLNVLDCVPSPLQHLVEMGRVLKAGAPALLTTPYDWSVVATPLGQWLGGHSQRAPAHGSSAAELRRALSAADTGLTLEAERDAVPWRVYMNERASMDYVLHLVRLVRGPRD
jgi:SAM-dependent methyltransferase